MAEVVEIEFKGSGTLFEQLHRLEGDVARLGDVHSATHQGIQDDLKTSGAATERFSSNIAGASQLVSALAKSAGQGLPSLAKNLASVADLTEQVQSSLSSTDKANLSTVNAALREMAQKAGLVVKELGGEKKVRLDNLVATQKITAAEAQLLSEVTAVVDTLREASEIPPPNQEPAIEQAKTLQQRYREAYQEAQRLAETPGPDFDRATAEAARLKEELADVRGRIDALNPDDKIGAFTKLGNALAGGAQAAGGFFLVFADGNQKLQETIFKFQSFLFALSGAQTFLADVKDAYSNVLAVLGLTTKEQIASTAASEADTVAKGGQAVATEAVGVASTTATTGIRAFFTAILASPLFPVAVALLAIGAAFAFVSGESTKATDSYNRFLEALNRRGRRVDLEVEVQQARLAAQLEEERAERQKEFEAGRRSSAERTAAEQARDAQRQAELNEKELSAERKINGLKQANFEYLQDLKRRAVSGNRDLLNIEIKDEQEFARLRSELGLDESATNEEVVKAYYDAKDEFRQEDLTAQADAINKQAQTLALINDAEEASLEKSRELARINLQVREELAANILALETQLAERIAELRLDQADPNERLELQRAANEKAVQELERNLRRELALETQSAERLAELSDAQRRELADRLIDEQGLGQLSVDQKAKFDALRTLNEQEYLKSVVALNAENAETLLSLQKDGAERQRAQLELDLVERADVLRKAQATDAQILADAANKRRELERNIAEQALDLEEQTRVDILEAKAASVKGDAALERAAQIEVLNVKIEFAEKALGLIEDSGTAESAAQIAAAKKEIAELRAALKGEVEKVVPVDIFDLLGFKFTAAEKQLLEKAFSDIKDSFVEILNAGIEADQMRLDQQEATTDELISDLQRRGEELQQELEKQEDLNRQGEANRLNDTLKAIEENKRAQALALAEKKRIQQEQAKLARQQVNIDAVAQGSSLLTGAANLIKSWSTIPFGIGLVSAFAQAALIYSFFANLKNRIASASVQNLFKGTKSVELNGAPKGIDTVPAMLNEDEAVVPTANNRKHRALVGAIIDDDFSNLKPHQIQPLLDAIDLGALLAGTGVIVNEKEVQEAILLQTHVHDVDRSARMGSMAGVERRLDELAQKLESFKRQESERPDKTVLPNGSVVIKYPGGTTEIITGHD